MCRSERERRSTDVDRTNMVVEVVPVVRLMEEGDVPPLDRVRRLNLDRFGDGDGDEGVLSLGVVDKDGLAGVLRDLLVQLLLGLVTVLVETSSDDLGRRSLRRGRCNCLAGRRGNFGSRRRHLRGCGDLGRRGCRLDLCSGSSSSRLRRRRDSGSLGRRGGSFDGGGLKVQS